MAEEVVGGGGDLGGVVDHGVFGEGGLEGGDGGGGGEFGEVVVINEGVAQSFTLFFSVTCVTCDMN